MPSSPGSIQACLGSRWSLQGPKRSALTLPGRQERWRVHAEQSKAESAQRALEEQRKVMVQQIAMEREELERAKVSPDAPRLAASLPSGPGMLTGPLAPSPQSALLEEQKSVMHKCGEERQRLAAEWAELFAQQKLRKERAEREAERALQLDTQREGTLVSLAKVGPRASRTVGTQRSPAPLPTLALTVCSSQDGQLQKARSSNKRYPCGTETTTVIIVTTCFCCFFILICSFNPHHGPMT